MSTAERVAPRRHGAERLATTLLAVLALAVPLLVPPSADAAGEPAPSSVGYEATIRRTEHGTAHVLADDLGSAGFGNGYAVAQDNICIIADELLTTRAARSRWFGAEGGNLASDLFWARIAQRGTVEQLLANGPDGTPPGPSAEARELVRGYAAGYNAYLRQVGGPDGITDPACSGAPWVTEITPMDVWRRAYQLSLFASGANFVEGIVAAAPPGSQGGGGRAPASAPALDEIVRPDLGSNGVGLGSEATESGNGIVLGNPHFPWRGSNRFWRVQLTVPGEIDVAGAALLGSPGVQIGHNASVGWTHTVSTGQRFTPFELQLGDDPTTYVVDGETRQMGTTNVTVQVLTGDGELATRSHTFHETEYGPMVVGAPFTWGTDTAYAFGDANADNMRHLDTWLGMARADSVRGLRDAIAEHQGIPWVNTIAADVTGEAMYADLSVKVNVPDSQLASCLNSPLAQGVYAARGIPVLDGSTATCDWQSDPDAAVDGIFGPGNLPVLFRDDYVANSNDSYWLSNPDAPLTGFAEVIGDEGTARSLRTRSGLTMIAEYLAGDTGNGTPGFTRDEVQAMVFANRVHAAELVADELVAACRDAGSVQVDGQQVELTAACDVLDAWDREVELDSRGAHLFREFVKAGGVVFADAFDPANPVTTPNDLAEDDPAVLQALGTAVQTLRAADVPLDAPLGEVQYELRGDEVIPIHGGIEASGVFNKIEAPFQGEAGYTPVVTGSSFVMVAEFTPDGPDSRALLTYSQSSDPTSPWYADQTRLYSDKQWTEMRFTEDEIQADPALTTTTVSSDVERVAGQSRIETAVAVSERTWQTTDTVVLARADLYADALVGAPLAAQLEAPVLLTHRDRVPASVLAEIDRLGASEVVLLGGRAALTRDVADQVRAAGLDVDRVAGPTRFATAVAIAERLTGTTDTVFVVEGADPDPNRGWPDAVSVAPYAATLGAPVLLATTETLPGETAAALADLDAQEAVVVGGPVAIGAGVVEQLRDQVPSVRRLAGETRYATSAEVAAEAAAEAGQDASHVWLATGRDWPDSLAAGPAVAARGASLLLVPADLADAPAVRDRLGLADTAVVVGGPVAVSTDTVRQVEAVVD